MRMTSRNRRGTSLLEVLIAMAIMVLIVVGILQMFWVALATNRAASSRTQLTFKAQQVAEHLKYFHYTAQQYGDAQIPSWASYLGQTVTQGSYTLPYTQSELEDSVAGGTYWGPQGVNVVEGAQMPYRLSYDISENTDAQSWVVTVKALPVQASDQASNAGPNLYQGEGLLQRKVQYVFNIKKPSS